MIKHGARCGDKKTREYRTWNAMRQRCFNRKNAMYHYYGGRGITVCKRWDKFENFLADMGPRPLNTSLDRFPDKYGNYEPGNCRWATPKQQQNNNRSNVIITFNGQTKTINDWSMTLGIERDTLYHRYANGWSTERMLTEKLNGRQKKDHDTLPDQSTWWREQKELEQQARKHEKEAQARKAGHDAYARRTRGRDHSGAVAPR